MDVIDPVVSLSFVMKIDDLDLGAFTGCEGLGCEVVLEKREEGGNNAYVWQLPTRLRYPNIKLTRPLGPYSKRVGEWFASMTTGVRRQNAFITALQPDGTTLAEWGLLDVVPVRWQGPSLSGDSVRVYTETVEIAHSGYLDIG